MLGSTRAELPPPAPALEPPAAPLEPPPPALPLARGPSPEPYETLAPVHFDEPGELALLANRILAVVQARLDAGGRLTDDDLVTKIEDVLKDDDR